MSNLGSYNMILLWWTFVSPFLMIAVFIGSLVTSVQYSNVSYYNYTVCTYITVTVFAVQKWSWTLSWMGTVFFWSLLLVILVTLPIFFVIRLIWKKEERHGTTKWFNNFPKRCHAAWDDFKDLFTSTKDRLFGNYIRYHWIPHQTP